MATYEGVLLSPVPGPDMGITFGGSASVAPVLGDSTTRVELYRLVLDGILYAIANAPTVGRFEATGNLLDGALVALVGADQAGRLELTGQSWVGRFIPLAAVYRNADRLTLAGLATDLAGNPLRSVQLQFIGETVQDNFEGAGTDSAGYYVAYLQVGDTYTAFAYSTNSGIVYRMEAMDEQPNTTTLTFRQITRRIAGDGVFLRGN